MPVLLVSSNLSSKAASSGDSVLLVPTLPRGNPCGDAPASYSPVAAIAGHATLERADACSHAGAWERDRRAIPGLVETLSLMHMGRIPP